MGKRFKRTSDIRQGGGTDAVPDFKRTPVSDVELFLFRELPGELRYLLAVSAELPDVAIHAAEAAQRVLSEIAGDSPASQLQRSAVELRSHAEQVQRAARDLLILAGRLQGLAWASWASEQASVER